MPFIVIAGLIIVAGIMGHVFGYLDGQRDGHRQGLRDANESNHGEVHKAFNDGRAFEKRQAQRQSGVCMNGVN